MNILRSQRNLKSSEHTSMFNPVLSGINKKNMVFEGGINEVTKKSIYYINRSRAYYHIVTRTCITHISGSSFCHSKPGHRRARHAGNGIG
jgi:hypothetical protein